MPHPWAHANQPLLSWLQASPQGPQSPSHPTQCHLNLSSTLLSASWIRKTNLTLPGKELLQKNHTSGKKAWYQCPWPLRLNLMVCLSPKSCSSMPGRKGSSGDLGLPTSIPSTRKGKGEILSLVETNKSRFELSKSWRLGSDQDYLPS